MNTHTAFLKVRSGLEKTCKILANQLSVVCRLFPGKKFKFLIGVYFTYKIDMTVFCVYVYYTWFLID